MKPHHNRTHKQKRQRRNTYKKKHRMSGGGMIWEGVKLGLKGVDFFIHLVI
jgi:hypothetical protein